jgi:hypothetical protein
MIACVAATFSGTGMQSFSVPFTGRIVGVAVTANQATPAACSINQLALPSSGVSGGDRALLCVFANAATPIPIIDFPVNALQLVFIDVKTAATFQFFVKVNG